MSFLSNESHKKFTKVTLLPIANLACRSCNPLYDALFPCPLPYAFRIIAIFVAIPLKLPSIAFIAVASLAVSGICLGVISELIQLPVLIGGYSIPLQNSLTTTFYQFLCLSYCFCWVGRLIFKHNAHLLIDIFA